MCKELIDMINCDDISPERFFSMDPFSYVNDRQYSRIAQSVHFFDDLYVISNKTYERLALLAKMATDSALSAIVVTGYSGSGKTNFLRYCEAIIKDEVSIPEYDTTQLAVENLYSVKEHAAGDTFFDYTQDKGLENELAVIKKGFTSSLHQIKKILYTQYRSCAISDIRSSIASFLNSKLKGNVIYFDFDADKQESKTPLELKLTRQIETHLIEIDEESIDRFFNFYCANKEEFKRAFENRDSFYFEKSIKGVYNAKNRHFDEYKEELSKNLGRLDIDQLMCIEVMLTIAKKIPEQPRTVFYFLDNIDLISGTDNTVLVNTISKFWDFLKEIQSFIHIIRKKTDYMEMNSEWIERYDKFKYVFSMRETTAMHIGDHLRNRISEFSKHFDISSDIQKSFILKKRFDLLNRNISEGNITNLSFINIAQNIEAITEDNYFKWYLFDIFNNDYRKAVDCLCALSRQSEESIKACIPLIEEDDPYRKFGGRGVIIKTMCDSFKRWKYFHSLKVPMRSLDTKNAPYNITLIRLILTVLLNHQCELAAPDQSTFFVERENCVSLRSLYEEVRVICPDKKTFINCIESMFSGRNWTYWNHLITFDNILNYSRHEIEQSLENEPKSEIYVRCTKAGEYYLLNLCVHYEFFACRYASFGSKGLFSGKHTQRKDGYVFERLIEDVIEYVQKCCLELHQVNLEIIKNTNLKKYNDLIYTQYVIDEQFHEERIIHNHITYLDAFRLYLIQGSLKNDTVNVNQILIGYIERYLDMLKYDNVSFYSANSEKLFIELNECIKLIKDRGYNDAEVVISRTYYSRKVKTKVIC